MKGERGGRAAGCGGRGGAAVNRREAWGVAARTRANPSTIRTPDQLTGGELNSTNAIIIATHLFVTMTADAKEAPAWKRIHYDMAVVSRQTDDKNIAFITTDELVRW